MARLQVILATVCLVVFLLSSILVAFAAGDWAMFRSDPSHSGEGTGNPVLNPTLLWVSHTAGSSLAFDRGVVYVGLAYDTFAL